MWSWLAWITNWWPALAIIRDCEGVLGCENDKAFLNGEGAYAKKASWVYAKHVDSNISAIYAGEYCPC